MNIPHPLSCERLHDRACWAQGIAQTLELYGKHLSDLPCDLQTHCEITNQSPASISQTELNRLWYAAASVTGDDSFGLRLGETFKSNNLHMLGLVATTSKTIGDAVERVLHYLPILSTQVQIQCSQDTKYLTIYFNPLGTPHPLHLEAVVAQCVKIWSKLQTGQTPLVTDIHLTSGQERSRTKYASTASGKIRLGAKRVSVRLNQALMPTPLPNADALLRDSLDASIERLLSELPKTEFAEQVKQRIAALVTEREVSEELTARPFNMSPRHLRRKLSQAQTSYERLLDEVRMESAVRLIEEGRLSLGHIALKLGFLNPSSFTRAFRRWTGSSPTEFKAKLVR